MLIRNHSVNILHKAGWTLNEIIASSAEHIPAFIAVEEAQTSLLARLAQLSNHVSYIVAQPALKILIELVSGSNEQQLEKLIEAGLLDGMKKGLNLKLSQGRYSQSPNQSRILYKLLENTHLSTVQFEICLKADIV